MPYTNFTNGLTSFGVPTMGTAGIPPTSGNIWFVNSVTGSDGSVGSFSAPFATTAHAIVAATAGDVIVWMAQHAETITAAGGITVNKAGLTFWGLGEGKEAPTFTATTATTATFLISSANTTIGGSVVTVCNIASQAKFFSVTAANVSITATHYDTSSSIGALTYITTSAAASNFFANVTYFGLTASTLGTSMILLVGVVDANITVNAYGYWSTAVVDFATTACVNIQVNGYFYNQNSSAASKDVVDTVGGSTWFVSGYDGQAGYSIVGGSAAAVAPQPIPSSLLAVPAANSTANVYERDVIGNKTDASVYNPSNTASLAAYVRGHSDILEQTSQTAAAVMSTALNVFTVAGGPIQILGLVSICATANGATASTLQWESLGTLGSTTQTISGASATLANAAAGTSVILQGTALSTAPIVNTNGAGLSETLAIVVPAGTITLVIGTGSTTGTWTHYLRYKPLGHGVTVTNAF